MSWAKEIAWEHLGSFWLAQKASDRDEGGKVGEGLDSSEGLSKKEWVRHDPSPPRQTQRRGTQDNKEYQDTMYGPCRSAHMFPSHHSTRKRHGRYKDAKQAKNIKEGGSMDDVLTSSWLSTSITRIAHAVANAIAPEGGLIKSLGYRL